MGLSALCLVGCGGIIDAPEGDGSAIEDEGAPEATPEPDPETVPEPEPEPSAEPTLVPVSLSQSTGSVVADANVNCRYGDAGHADTRHVRVLSTALAPDGGTVTEAVLPIELADAPEGSQPATLRLHRLTGDLATGQRSLLGEVPFTVPNQVFGEVRVLMAVDFDAGDVVVAEVSVPDGEQVRNLRFGHNFEPQTGPTYLASDACGLPTPTDIATIADPRNPGLTFATQSWLVSLSVDPLPPL